MGIGTGWYQGTCDAVKRERREKSVYWFAVPDLGAASGVRWIGGGVQRVHLEPRIGQLYRAAGRGWWVLNVLVETQVAVEASVGRYHGTDFVQRVKSRAMPSCEGNA